MTLLSYLVGNRLAQQVVRPIGKLAFDPLCRRGRQSWGATRRWSFPPPIIPATKSASGAGARLSSGLRLHGFVKRELLLRPTSATVAHRSPSSDGAAEVLVVQLSLPPPGQVPAADEFTAGRCIEGRPVA